MTGEGPGSSPETPAGALGSPAPSTWARASWWRWAAVAVAVVVAARPVYAGPTTGLDPSWRTGLNLARLDGLRFGPDLLFTYGPWGALDVPLALQRSTVGLALVLAVVSTAVLCWAVVLGFSRSLAPLPAAAAGAITAAAASSLSDPTARVLLAVMAVVVIRATGTWRPASDRGLFAGLAFAAGALVTVKVSAGVLAAGIVVLGAVTVARRVWSSLATVAGAIGVGVLASWLVAGQWVTDLPAWARGAADLTFGYSEAMAYEVPGLEREYVLFGLLAAVALISAYLLGARLPRLRRAGLLVLVLVVCWVLLRLGFTRHDAHSVDAFVGIAVALVAVGPGIPTRAFRVLVPALAPLVAIEAEGVSVPEVLSPVEGWTSLATAARGTLSPSLQEQTLEASRQRTAAEYNVPPAALTAIGTRTVQVDPYETTAAWTYGLDWRPVPVFQSYAAYTPYLDGVNADSLRSPTGPGSLLRQSIRSIDGRFPLRDTPESLLASVCSYRVAYQDSWWQVLTRAEDRCGTEKPLGSAEIGPDRPARVPTAPHGAMVLARLRTESTWQDRVAGLLLKPGATLLVTTVPGRAGRLPRAMQGQPLAVLVPDSTGWSREYGGGDRVDALWTSQPGTVEFSFVSVRP